MEVKFFQVTGRYHTYACQICDERFQVLLPEGVRLKEKDRLCIVCKAEEEKEVRQNGC